MEQDYYRLTLPEALLDGFRWITNAHSTPGAAVELVFDRHESGTELTGNIGTRIFLFKVNQTGNHEVYFDYVKFSSLSVAPTKDKKLKTVRFKVREF